MFKPHIFCAIMITKNVGCLNYESTAGHIAGVGGCLAGCKGGQSTVNAVKM